MDKLKLWLIPGIIVIIAIGGLVFLRGKTPKAEPMVVEEEEEKPVKGFAKPVEPPPEEKARINAGAMSDALYSGDISDCDKIIFDEELQKKCRDNLNYVDILKSGDESQCELLNDEILKKQCYDKIYLSAAVDQQDLSLCEMIADPVTKSLCKDQVQTILARHATSADECESIQSSVLKQQCLDTFQLKASAETLNIENCDNISDPSLAEQCKTTVTQNIKVVEESQQAAQASQTSKTPQELFNMCESLTGKRAIACKDAVYPELAYAEKDPSYCDKMSNEQDIADCKKQTEESINQYYLRESIAKRDKSMCEKITDIEVKELCFNS